ncbi:hypothetical protein M1247_07130 [Mycobacterium sp. 21AC1]|uniref:hypothetical protein n=1 Tax=[Mycobacterium] appelbergii TaxID=2939269 RepID=UPI0029392EA0|nr:hypothetical protein [Mycobacterium sp. 21AC1]MDV3124681.1 hypothetical protein [Mycobacterium sp. 21AC1]
MTTTTATPRTITRRDLAAKVTTDEMAELDVCIHEGLHCIATALMGGRVRSAIVTRPDKVAGHSHGATVFDPGMSRDRNAAIGFAGPWSDARWLTGERPTRRALAITLENASKEDTALIAAGGGYHAVDPGVRDLLERCWPSAVALAGKLFKNGEVRHEHVLAALGLTEENAAHGLAIIKAGSAPGSFRIDGTVRF